MPQKKILSPLSRIVFTGGGTGGHVIPNLAIIAELRKIAPRAEIFYVGSHAGIERELVKQAGIPYFSVATGKLRRYFSWENLRDATRVPLGILQAVKLLRELKPNAVFAKGGYVSVPTALAAGLLGIPLIIHESDSTLGLATRICARFANQVCLSFPAPSPSPFTNTILTGNPIRKVGDAKRGKKFLNFQNQKPILLVTGGSTGAQFLNELTEKILSELVKVANVVWLTGPGKNHHEKQFGNPASSGQVPKSKIQNPKLHESKPNLKTTPAIKIFEYLNEEYPDVLAVADLVVSRAGANAIFEIAACGKPSVLIPLPTLGSRGDQLLNARYFERAGASLVLEQEKIQPTQFLKVIQKILADKKQRAKMGIAARKLAPRDAARKITKIIVDMLKK